MGIFLNFCFVKGIEGRLEKLGSWTGRMLCARYLHIETVAGAAEDIEISGYVALSCHTWWGCGFCEW